MQVQVQVRRHWQWLPVQCFLQSWPRLAMTITQSMHYAGSQERCTASSIRDTERAAQCGTQLRRSSRGAQRRWRLCRWHSDWALQHGIR